MRHFKPALVLAVTALWFAAGCGGGYRLSRDEVGLTSVWPYHRGDLASSGSLPDGAFSGRLDVVWEFTSNDKPAGPMVISHGRLAYSGTRKKIKFLDPNTGKYLGHIKSKGAAQTGIVVKDSLGCFAVGPAKNKLRCVNLLNGHGLWTRRVKDAAGGSIIVENRLLVGSGDGCLLALGLLDGQLEWSFRAEGKLTVPATYGLGKILQPCDNGILYALSPDSGKEIFRTRLDGPIVSPVSAAGLIYCADMTGNVYGIDPADGNIAWRSYLGGPIWTSVAVADGRLVVGHSGGEVVALDAASGRVLWRFDTGEVVRSSAVIAGKYVVVGTMGGKLYSLTVADGKPVDRRQLKGAIITAPVTDGSRVYVATEKGRITCFGEADGKIH